MPRHTASTPTRATDRTRASASALRAAPALLAAGLLGCLAAVSVGQPAPTAADRTGLDRAAAVDPAALRDADGPASLERFILTNRPPDDRFTGFRDNRWNTAVDVGTPLVITWSLAEPGLSIPQAEFFQGAFRPGEAYSLDNDIARPNRLFAEFDSRFPGGRETWLPLVEEAFDYWSTLTNLEFLQVTDPTQFEDLDNDGVDESPVPWDDGAPWDSTDPIDGGTDAIGDIRIALKDLSAIGGGQGAQTQYNAIVFGPQNGFADGNIILNAAVSWEEPGPGFRYDRFLNTLTRSIGIALGLEPTCSAPGADPLLDRIVVPLRDSFPVEALPRVGLDDPRLIQGSDPIDDRRFRVDELSSLAGQLGQIPVSLNTLPLPSNGPPAAAPDRPYRFQDDARGIQFLYGDPLEPNDVIAEASRIPYSAQEAFLQGTGQRFRIGPVSLHDATDIDYYLLDLTEGGRIPEGADTIIDLTVDLVPIGGADYISFFADIYESDEPPNETVCSRLPGGSAPDAIDPQAQLDLNLALLEADGAVIAEVNDNVSGPDFGEALTPSLIPITTTRPLIIRVQGAITPAIDNTDPNVPQLYALDIRVGREIGGEGAGDISGAINDVGRSGLGASYFANAPNNTVFPPNEGGPYTGSTSVVGSIDGTLPAPGHATLQFVPGLSGAAPVNIALPSVIDTADGHATAAAAMAVGNPVGIEPNAFVGVAPGAGLVGAAVATRRFPNGGFQTSREAVAYALFSMANPDFLIGDDEGKFTEPVDVILNSWGVAAQDLRGDGIISQIYDAAAFMYDMPIVSAIGNYGDIDQTDECGTGESAGGDIPGGPFRGGRTAAYPSTAFNVIAVGSLTRTLEPGENVDQLELSNIDANNVADRSSKGPIDAYDFEEDSFQFNVRPGIDLVALGDAFADFGADPDDLEPEGEPCDYTGHISNEGLRLPDFPSFDDPLNPANPLLFANRTGTSFAAGTVAGGIALLADVAEQNAAAVPGFQNVNASLYRAILLNSAYPMEGWTNTLPVPAKPIDNRDGQEDLEGRVVRGDPTAGEDTEANHHAVDYAQGAGILGLDWAYQNFYTGYGDESDLYGGITRDVALTPPDVAVITTPPNEVLVGGSPFPGFGAAAPPGRSSSGGDDRNHGRSSDNVPDSVDDLPLSNIDIYRRIQTARSGVPNLIIGQSFADTGDPDLGTPREPRSGLGAEFDIRNPFKLVPGPDRPDIVITPDPEEIPALSVEPIGWDVGVIGNRTMVMPANPSAESDAQTVRYGYIDYFIEYPFFGPGGRPSGDFFSAALAWMRHVVITEPSFDNPDNPFVGVLEELKLDDLNLQLIQADALGNINDDNVFLAPIPSEAGQGQVWDASGLDWNNFEYFGSFPEPGFYVLRVSWSETTYNLFDDIFNGNTEFAVAWRTQPAQLIEDDSDPNHRSDLGFRDPEGSFDEETLLAARTAPASYGRTSIPMRIMHRFIEVYGSRRGDQRFDQSFDIDRDGDIDYNDFLPVVRRWF